MSLYDNFGKNCDYLRERYKLPVTCTLYEIIERVVNELKALKEIDNGKSGRESGTGNRGYARSQ